MNEIQRLKAIVKRRDGRITLLKKEVKELRNSEDYLRGEVDRHREREEEFKQALIRFLDLDNHIREVVGESMES